MENPVVPDTLVIAWSPSAATLFWFASPISFQQPSPNTNSESKQWQASEPLAFTLQRLNIFLLFFFLSSLLLLLIDPNLLQQDIDENRWTLLPFSIAESRKVAVITKPPGSFC